MVILSAIQDSSLSFAELAEEFRAGSVMLFKLCFLCIVMVMISTFYGRSSCIINYVLRDLQRKLSCVENRACKSLFHHFLSLGYIIICYLQETDETAK